ncbi:uncharacterized protein LOC135847744 [Planococcus citri]|uniref:uncharacterized protein LOC135847744 n=1 Tax=Planococcus citri TaxID=170843 RepID=UPI0031F8BBBA
MEVEQLQVSEMAQVSPEVYDMIHSTTVSLKELSAITVSLEILWRREITNEHRQTSLLKSFRIGQRDSESVVQIPWKAVLPDLPSAIYDLVNKYVIVLRNSLSHWLTISAQYTSDFECWSEFLGKFADFVCDYDGAVHFRRTAERILRCDRVSDDMKFRIACAYYFEDDIRRLWPFVSKNMDIDSIDFRTHPHTYYWICRLSNKLDKISLTEGNVNIDEEMLNQYWGATEASLEYFWKGVSVENRMQKAVDVHCYDPQCFVRIILPKLDDQQLEEFVNERGHRLMFYLLRTYWNDERLVLKTWLYIRNVMNRSTFTKHVFMQGLLKDHHREVVDESDDGFDGISVVRNSFLYLCSEIWNNTPDNLKQSAIADLLSGSKLLERFQFDMWMPDNYCVTIQLNVELLLIILRCVSFAERNSFWHNCWHLLIAMVPGEDLQRIMNLCFENNERKMAKFKQHTMAISETVRELCVELLRKGKHFNYLIEFVSFMCPEKQTASDYKQLIVESYFLGQCYSGISNRSEKFIEFITDAYTTVDELSVDFKTQPMFSEVWANTLIKFIHEYVSTEEAVVQRKIRIAELVKEYLTINRHLLRSEEPRDKNVMFDFNKILLWCLGSEEEVEKFESMLQKQGLKASKCNLTFSF